MSRGGRAEERGARRIPCLEQLRQRHHRGRFDGAKTFLAERAGEVDSTNKRQKMRESGGAGPDTVGKEENEVPLKL